MSSTDTKKTMPSSSKLARLLAKSKTKTEAKTSSKTDSHRKDSENKENSKAQPESQLSGASNGVPQNCQKASVASSKPSEKLSSGKSSKMSQEDWLLKQQEALREFEEAKRIREGKSQNQRSPPVVPAPEVDISNVPSEFLCPISQEIMVDPVLTTSGNCYDRRSIEQWLRTKDTDPLTNVRLQSKILIPNRPLRGLIEQHLATRVRNN